MKYDDASWHTDGDFPADLPPAAAGTHSAMYVAWAFLSGLGGDIPKANFPELISRLQARLVTPGVFFIEGCRGKFLAEDLNDEGNAFTRAYFDFADGRFLQDYDATLGIGLDNIYRVADTWDNFDRLKPFLDARFREWKYGPDRTESE
jgi:hypothetical protein